MFREMRKKERQLGGEDIIEILNKGEYGVLATVSDNAYPYAVPVSYVYINDSVYFHCAMEGQKLDNIKYSDKVCFTVIGNTKVLPEKFSTLYESVIIFGRASFPEGDEKVKALEAIIDKYSPDFKAEGMEYISRASSVTNVIKIEVEHITGKGRR